MNIQGHKNSTHQTHSTNSTHQGTDIRGSPRPRGYVHQRLGFPLYSSNKHRPSTT